jgi:hypothetical protein
MTVGDQWHDKRADAGQHLADALRREAAALDGQRQQVRRAGELGGFPLTAQLDRTLNGTIITLELEGAPGTSIVIPAAELADADPATLVTRLENRLRRLEERRGGVTADAAQARREIEHANAGARERVRQIDAELERIAEPARGPAAVTADGAQPQERGPVREEPVVAA